MRRRVTRPPSRVSMGNDGGELLARLLIIDDSESAAGRLVALAERLGHVATAVVGNGRDGVSAYREHQPELVLLDVTMPQRGGLEALRDIVSTSPSARILMMGAGDDAPLIASCLRAGATGVCTKPQVGGTMADDNELVYAMADALALAESERQSV